LGGRDCLEGPEEEDYIGAWKTLTVDRSKLVAFDWRRSGITALSDELTRMYPPIGTGYGAPWGRRGRRSVTLGRVRVRFSVNGGVGGRISFL
jgi:hypothetical protein